jgi:hypothetical protein
MKQRNGQPPNVTVSEISLDLPAIQRLHDAITPGLEVCFRAGCLERLFPLLAGWRPQELRALRRDVARFYRLATEETETSYRRDSLRPENLRDAARSAAIDDAYLQARIINISMATELFTVIRFFLEAERYCPTRGRREAAS